MSGASGRRGLGARARGLGALALGLGALALGPGLAGCAVIEGEHAPVIPRPPTEDSPTGWLVGAAEIDITPPPGYAMGGHSIEGVVASGVWTRLRAQALYFEDARGVPLVLVVCDLWSVEAGLVDRVAERIAEHPGLRHVGRQHVIVAATHTHHSPGHFSSAPIYTSFAASEPGHDPALFEALAGRIAAAVAEAAAARRPARITRHAVAVPAVARNRSVVPFLQDPEAATLLRTNAGLVGCRERPSAQGVDPCHAVHPVLEVLRVTEAEGDRTIGVVANFAMHPTAMPNKTELYHADAFGIASTRAQARLRGRDDGTAVVALFNGAQGDVSPDWDPQGRPSTVELGHALGEAIVAAVDEPGRAVEGHIEVAYAVRPLGGRPRFVDEHGQEQRGARRAISGKGQMGGAEDGRTRAYDFGFREGKRRRRPSRNGHGHKRPAVPWPLSGFAPPPAATPTEVPLTVAQLGSVPLVTMPGELTTVLGLRIRSQVAEVLPGDGPVITLGLAGGYASYFTTPQEYALQHYEGASTLYGEQAGALLTHHLVELARSGAVEVPLRYRYRAGQIRRWSMSRRRIADLHELEDRLAVQLDTGPLEGLPRFYAWDGAPTWPTDDPHAMTSPRARVQAWDDEAGWIDFAPDGIPVDDRAGHLAMLLTHVDGDRWRWGVWWLEPGAPLQQPLRFRVETVTEGPVCSEAFTTGQWFRPQGPGWLEPRPCAEAPPRPERVRAEESPDAP